MEYVLFFLHPCVHTKENNIVTHNFLGHLHFGQRTNKVVHFRKLEDDITIKTKKLDASALAQKQPHRKLGVVGGGETMMSFLGRRPRPIPRASLLHGHVGN